MKKIITRDSDNILTEVAIYDVPDFISTFVPSSIGRPVKTNANGLIDPTLLGFDLSASVLEVTKTAGESLLVGDVVRPTDDHTVKLAIQDGTLEESMVLGIVTKSGLLGEQVKVCLLGALTWPAFSVFPINRPLYLDGTGLITDDRPTSGYIVPVGKSLGGNTIMIQIEIGRAHV